MFWSCLVSIYYCLSDPAKIAANEGFEGPEPEEAVGKESNDTIPVPVNTTIPVHVREQWFGGMIADLVIPITGPIVDWHLEISFPRQVFRLEVSQRTRWGLGKVD